MANFVAIVDPNSERRSHYIKTIQPLLPPVAGLISNSCAVENFEAIWAANPKAPISCVADTEGTAVVWGEAIATHQSEPLSAPHLLKLWKDSQTRSFPTFDGFYAAIAYHPNWGLSVAADLLGLFPVYYYTHGDIALIGSSPELFRYHPLFTAQFNPRGLVGILLTNGTFEGQTLWQDVYRLAAGYSLQWQPHQKAQEIQQYQIPQPNSHKNYQTLSFDQQLDVLEQAIDQALTRQAPATARHALLLSGGLDSRTLAGLLHRRGVETVALSLGVNADIDMQCAKAVARTLGMEHHHLTIPSDKYPEYANLLVKWEHLVNGFNWVMDWGIYSYLQNLAPRIVGGHSLGPILGIKVAYSLPNQPLSFDTFFGGGVNRWGFSPPFLEQLLRKEVFGDLVNETIARIRTTYESYAEDEFRRAWWFDLYHRQRFHIGCSGWQLSFGAWPVLPFLDWQVLETTGTLPVQTIGKRRGENELLRTRFPQLAQLPLDQKNFNVEPLQPSPWRQQLGPWFGLQRKWRRWLQKQGIERRYYYRIYNINDAGWRQVRRQAEPYREQVGHLFHLDVLNQVLPPPEESIQFKADSIMEASGLKLLLGFLLWSKDHL